MNVLIFDIETVPDTCGGAKLLELEGLSKKDIIKAMEHTQFQNCLLYTSPSPRDRG